MTPTSAALVRAHADEAPRARRRSWRRSARRRTENPIRSSCGLSKRSAWSRSASSPLPRSPDAQVLSDGLACFAAVADVGCTHTAIKTGAGPRAAKTPAFKWVNTALGNIKAALVGTYRAVREKHVPRYLAEFEYRFNRRYDLGAMIPRLAFVALRTAPMPYRCLKLADFQA